METRINAKIIKAAIRRDLIYLLENGMKWLVFTGNLGFEVWVLEVAKELQEEYNFQLATIFIFENQGEKWNEVNQEKWLTLKNVDFIKYAYQTMKIQVSFGLIINFVREHRRSLSILR